jgi:hypothetical protein
MIKKENALPTRTSSMNLQVGKEDVIELFENK